MFLSAELIRDVIGSRPAAGSKGRRFTSTDEGIEYYDDGSAWQPITLDAGQITSGTLPAARLPNPSASTLGGVESIAPVSHQFLTSIDTSGVPAQAALIAGDIPAIAESGVTGLVSDLAAKTAKYTTSWSAQTSVTVTHGLGTTAVIVQVFDASGVLVIPESVTVTSSSVVTLTFGAAFTGSVVVIG